MQDDISRLPESDKFIKHIEISINQISIFDNFLKRSTIKFPQSTYAEVNGTYVNFQNRVQRLKPAVVTLELERLIGDFAMSRLDKFGAQNDSWTHGTRFNARPGWKILKQIAKSLGVNFDFENSEEVFEELCNTIPSMKGWNYDTIGDKGKVIVE